MSQTVAKISSFCRSASTTRWRPEASRRGLAGQHERAPGHAERDAQRRLVGTVAAHVADDGTDRAVVELDGVEEVAAQQDSAPPGGSESPSGPLSSCRIGRGQQSPFESCVLGADSSASRNRAWRPRLAVERWRSEATGPRSPRSPLPWSGSPARPLRGPTAAELVVQAGEDDDGEPRAEVQQR